MISIIIPFKDNVELLKQCVFSILEKATYVDYEILLIDNQSTQKETMQFVDKIKNHAKIKSFKYDKAFNFSAINNFAASKSSKEYLLFLNNDTEVISSNWLKEMIKCFDDKSVGAVGVKLLYPNNTIQHCGVQLSKKNLAIHQFRTMSEEVVLKEKIECPAITGACMLTKKELFLEVGGFDEINLPVAYNDIDYCLRIGEFGYKIICLVDVKLYHYESASRKSDIWARIFNRKRYKSFLNEQRYFRNKWSNQLR